MFWLRAQTNYLLFPNTFSPYFLTRFLLTWPPIFKFPLYNSAEMCFVCAPQIFIYYFLTRFLFTWTLIFKIPLYNSAELWNWWRAQNNCYLFVTRFFRFLLTLRPLLSNSYYIIQRNCEIGCAPEIIIYYFLTRFRLIS